MVIFNSYVKLPEGIFSNPEMSRFSSGESHWFWRGASTQRAVLLDTSKARESSQRKQVSSWCLVLPGILFFHLLQQVGLVLKAHPKGHGQI
jgi:hypothetical protein